jgi:EmrB/QacA subfamily drug resistance transporter
MQGVSYKYLVAAVYVVALFMDLLDITIVYVALPTLGREFEAGASTLEWVVTGYLLSLAVWVPASGWLGDRFGTRRVFLAAIAIFTVGSLLCALAWDIGSLIAFRIVQGAGGGMLTPVGLAMLFRVFPAEERPRVGAILLAPSLIAPTLGPLIGGLLVAEAGWRWIFLLNLPFGVGAFAVAAVFLREHREPGAGRFDAWGFVGSGAGLALVLYALSRAPQVGWTSWPVLATGLGGLAALAALVLVELRSAAPMLDLRVFADRTFRLVNLYFFVLFSGWMGVTFLLPLYLQDLRGLSALESGLSTFPQALGMILMMRPATRLARAADPRLPLAAGAVGIVAVTAPLLLLGPDTDLWLFRAVMLVRGMAMGLIAVTLQTAPFTTVGLATMGRASALYSVNRHVASALGIAVLATVLIEAGGLRPPAGDGGALSGDALTGFHAAFAVSLAASLLAAGLALALRDRSAAPQRGRRSVPVAEPTIAD